MSTPLEQRFKLIPAVYVLFRDGDKVLLLRRANTTYYDGYYSLPAGHVDGNESTLRAAIREAKEEVNAEVARQELELVHVMHRVSDIPSKHERLDLYFQTTQKHPEIQNTEPEKCDELRWCPIKELPENMVPEVGHVLENMANNQLYSEFGF